MEVPLGDTYYFLFTTRAFATGIPTTLAGTPVLSVYEENNLTQITTGVTVDIDFDTVTGLNEANVVATSGNGYEAGKYYSVVITTGTVATVSVVGEVVGHFRVMPAEDAGAGIKDVNTTHVSETAQTGNDNGADINTLLTRIIGTLAAGTHTAQSGDGYAIVNNITYGNAQLVRSTTPANTLDVSATGEAGIDWANVGGTTSTVVLTNTTVGTVTANTDMRGTENALLAASAPANFGDLAITLTTGQVTVGTNTDKTGYSISGTLTTLDALENISTTDVKTEADLALADVNLDHLVGTATAIPAVPAGTFLDQIMDDGTAVFDRTTDSLQAIADSGGGGPTAAQIADAVWDETATGHTDAGKAGAQLWTDIDAILVDTNELQLNQGNWLTATGFALDTVCTEARLAELDGANLPADVAAVKVDTAAILVDTGTDGVVISGTTANQIADALLNRDMSLVSDTNSRSPLNGLRFMRNAWDATGGTLTVTKEDDTTTAWTSALTSNPAANPITGSDPA